MERIKLSIEEANNKIKNSGKSHIKALENINGVSFKYDFYCEKHNLKFNTIFSNVINKKYACPKCGLEGQAKGYLSHYNLWDIRPDIAELLKNPDDAIGLAEFSNQKKEFVCPNCKKVLKKVVYEVSSHGLSCNYCSDGFSYPNKVMANVLSSINVDFIPEYSPEWISPKRYDFYIQKDNIIIEVDGEIGHGKKEWDLSVEESIEIDDYKDLVAKNHGIEVIRIDSGKSNINNLKNNIINSELSNYYNFSNVDWNNIDVISSKSLFLEVCKFEKKHPYYDTEYIANKFHINRGTVSKYINKGIEYGLCERHNRVFDKQVLCLDSQIIFASSKAAGRYYNLDSSAITKCCKHKLNSVHSLHFIYLKDYDGDIKDLRPNYDVAPKLKYEYYLINVYFNKEYIETSNSIKGLGRKYNFNEATVKNRLDGKNNHFLTEDIQLYYSDDPNQPDKSKIITKEKFKKQQLQAEQQTA